MIATGAHMQVLELPNNRFTRFPIELHRMKGLKRLNLANNSLALLPRNIDVMTSLEFLDLRRCAVACCGT